MSFLRRNLSSYPQPVLVTPDPRESISDAVADAIESTQAGAHETASTTSHPGETDSIYEGQQSTDDQHQHQLQHQLQVQHKDNTKIADGLMSLMGPIVQEMDFNIVSVRKSQTELEREIERLLAELQLFMASSAAPPEVEPALQKLVRARRQIMGANITLKAVQDRVDRMCLQTEKQRQ
ncbi:hypothetical protein MVEG_06903 [Podila verticillata NRRL 6337]|nr:MAG: hypothetical protein BYD32DRAFT_465426 [Podila humilis]KFH68174.1 hypothetical protein MVEG_06903 [Podila verticillata NRRL 6337]